jgi:Helix-turn-helix domain
VTPAELIARIERDLAELESALCINTETAYRESPYLDVDEAARYCRVAVRTIYNNRRFITRQPGITKLLFTREALDKWLGSRKKPR